jgi:hypothetical protein
MRHVSRPAIAFAVLAVAVAIYEAFVGAMIHNGA